MLREIRENGAAHEGTFVADMSGAARITRIYDAYLMRMTSSAAEEEVEYLAVSLVGPKNRIDKLVGRIPLMP